ncbi:MAG: alanine--tRNA ligase [Flavobacteriales bacterium]|jgi:alanyl-tRNA synthetase|nr:alanine--tRNA ligase [Flavobacteriales bacterium]
MNSNDLRKLFLEFFKANDHDIICSAPIVVQNDPTLMFTNAGMNQFKNYFLDIDTPKFKRVANSQKCIRVSGKHNDLEEVGHDTYHHTMFEMLGSWSFGDYSKETAISLAWNFLVDKCNLNKDRIYVSIFEGNDNDKVAIDSESLKYWKKYVNEDKIIFGNKNDNFWEMGEIGPCGPCTEIHYDNRPEYQLGSVAGSELVNKDHPDVIEIWNLVFMEYNRNNDGTLNKLSTHHVDTGMGFERLCMITQNVRSNYDTDIFQSLIQRIADLSDKRYGDNSKVDIAMRVIADHVRAVAFSIADNQLPSNVKAGYVIRRILRRAIRYAYTFLDLKTPFIFELVDVLVLVLGDHYNELIVQKDLIKNVIKQEEESFLRTLASGLKRIEDFTANSSLISGVQVFELYDTYGFPKDLSKLILKEKNIDFDENEFDIEMKKQQDRSKKTADNDVGQWKVLLENSNEDFVGYESLDFKTTISRYRISSVKDQSLYHITLDKTPFYAEGGGQIGDTGFLIFENEKIRVIDTKKENNLIYQIVDKLPVELSSPCLASIDKDRRLGISRNHTATHLLHDTLRNILGNHVVQKGSLVSDSYLRFDFSHFSSVTKEQLKEIEQEINSKILNNISLDVSNDILLSEAKKLGALMLFGEKYGDKVRLIEFDSSKELCGGTHVKYTGEIGLLKITSEASVASGIRRIEAITGVVALDYLNKQDDLVKHAELTLKNKDLLGSIKKLKKDNKILEKELKYFQKEALVTLSYKLLDETVEISGINFVSKELELNPSSMKEIASILRSKTKLVVVLAVKSNNKALISLMISDDLVSQGYNSSDFINNIAKEISGSGGGQPYYSTAGGSNVNGITKALLLSKELFSK